MPNAIGALDQELLCLRVSGVPKMATGSSGARITLLTDCLGGEVMCVLLAALGLIATGPVGDDFFEVCVKITRNFCAAIVAGLSP